MRLGRDGIAGLIGLAVSLALLPAAYGLPKLPIVPVGPGFYPTLVLTFMALTSTVLLIQDVMTQRRAPAVAPSGGPAVGAPRAYGLVLAAFVAVAIYIALLPLLGFRISTALFVGGFQAVLEPPRDARSLAIQLITAVGTAAVTYLVFERYLLVILPRGSWTNW
jgi:hypothetical protein